MFPKKSPNSLGQFAPPNTDLAPQTEIQVVPLNIHPAQLNPVSFNPSVFVQTPLQIVLKKYHTEFIEVALIRAARVGDLNAVEIIFNAQLIDNSILQTMIIGFLLEKNGVIPVRKDDSNQDEEQRKHLLDECEKQRKECCDDLKKLNENFNALEEQSIFFGFCNITISVLSYEMQRISNNIDEFMKKRKVLPAEKKYIVELITSMKIMNENIEFVNKHSQFLSINKGKFLELRHKIELLSKETSRFLKLPIEEEIPENKPSKLVNKIKAINQAFDQFKKEIIEFQKSSDAVSVDLEGGTYMLQKERDVTYYETSCILQSESNPTKNRGEVVIIATNIGTPGVANTARIGTRISERQILTLFKLFTTKNEKILFTGVKDINNGRNQKSEANPSNQDQSNNEIMHTSVSCTVLPAENSERPYDSVWDKPDRNIIGKFPDVFTRNCRMGDIWHENPLTPIKCHGTVPTVR